MSGTNTHESDYTPLKVYFVLSRQTPILTLTPKLCRLLLEFNFDFFLSNSCLLFPFLSKTTEALMSKLQGKDCFCWTWVYYYIKCVVFWASSSSCSCLHFHLPSFFLFFVTTTIWSFLFSLLLDFLPSLWLESQMESRLYNSNEAKRTERERHNIQTEEGTPEPNDVMVARE